MPQIRSRTVLFDGKDYVRKTTVDKEGVFRIRMPMAAREILGIDEISAPTMKEVEKLWDQKVEEYRKAGTTTRKVIYYKFESNSAIFGPDPDDPDDEICIFASDDIAFCDGVTIALAAQVLTETAVTHSDGRKHYNYKKEDSTLPRSMVPTSGSFGPSALHRENDLKNMIDWTPEREAFFKQIGEAIETLIMNMDGLLNNQERLLEVADSGVPALGFDAASTRPEGTKKKKRGARHARR